MSDVLDIVARELEDVRWYVLQHGHDVKGHLKLKSMYIFFILILQFDPRYHSTKRGCNLYLYIIFKIRK